MSALPGITLAAVAVVLLVLTRARAVRPAPVRAAAPETPSAKKTTNGAA